MHGHYQTFQPPFFALCGDDDVFTGSGIRTAIQCLLTETDLDVVVGRAIMACPSDNRQLRWRHVHSEWRDSQIWRSERPVDRVVSGDGMGFYSIGRTATLSRLWAYVLGSSTDLPYFDEYLIKYLTQLATNLRVVDSLIWIRGPENPQVNPRAGNHTEFIKNLLLSPGERELVTKRLVEGILILRQEVQADDALRAGSSLVKLHESEVMQKPRPSNLQRAANFCHRVVISYSPDWFRLRLYRFLDHRKLDTGRNPLAYSANVDFGIEHVLANLRQASIQFDEDQVLTISALYEDLLGDRR